MRMTKMPGVMATTINPRTKNMYWTPTPLIPGWMAAVAAALMDKVSIYMFQGNKVV